MLINVLVSEISIYYVKMYARKSTLLFKKVFFWTQIHLVIW